MWYTEHLMNSDNCFNNRIGRKIVKMAMRRLMDVKKGVKDLFTEEREGILDAVVRNYYLLPAWIALARIRAATSNYRWIYWLGRKSLQPYQVGGCFV